MKRSVKNILCVGGMLAFAGAGVFAGMDAFGHKAGSREFAVMEESFEFDRDFGGFGEDREFDFDKFDEDREFSFDSEERSERPGRMEKSEEDTSSSATDEAGTAEKKQPSSKPEAESETQTEKTGMTNVAFTMEAGSFQGGEGMMVRSNMGQMRKSGSISSMILFAETVIGFALLAVWMVISKANKLSFAQVFSGKKDAAKVMEAPVMEGEFTEKTSEEKADNE